MKQEQLITTYRYVLQRYALDRYEDAALEELQRVYRNARKKVNRDIAKAIKGTRSSKRLGKLLNEIDSMLLTLTAKLTPVVAEVISEAGAYSYTNTSAILSWDGKVDGFNNVALSANQVAALVTAEKLGGYDLDGWLWSALNAENGALKAEINAAKVRGVGYKKLMSELGSRYERFFKDNKSRQSAEDNLETVVKSYVQSVNAKAHKDLYEANKEVIEEVEWSAIMENGNAATGRGTCSRCMALDGQTYTSVDMGPTCPLHPRCRCMYVPVVKTWKELGFTAAETAPLKKKWNIRDLDSKSKEVKPSRRVQQYGLTDGNYADWWKTRSKKFQDNALGPARAELVRSGAVDFKDIVDKHGDLVQLEYMARSTSKKYKKVNNKLLNEVWPTRKGNSSKDKG